MTMQEDLQAINEKLDELKAALTPPEPEQEPENPLTIECRKAREAMIASVGQYEALCQKILATVESIAAREPATEAPATADFVDEEEPADHRVFANKRWLFVSAGMASSALLSALMYKWCLPLFSTAFGVTFVFVMISLALIIDRYYWPGNTIRRIASNAVSASIGFLAVCGILVAGISIGNSLITRPFESGGERDAVSERIETGQPSTGQYSDYNSGASGSGQNINNDTTRGNTAQPASASGTVYRVSRDDRATER